MTSPSFYCFPDISRKVGSAAAPAARTQPGFQRLTPGPRSDGSRLRPFGSIPAGRPGAASHVHAEDLEQAAFCRGFSDGEKKGYEQGERDGRDAALKQLEPVLQSLRQMLAELESLRRRESRDLEKELVELALAVARKVVGREVAVRPDTVAHLMHEAIGRLEHAGILTIRLNPADLERLSGGPAHVLNGLADPGRVRFEADASVSVGGCFIESDVGDMDARIEQRWRVVEEAFQATGRLEADGMEAPG
jgi:flagellar assembly protein FliH